VTPGLRAATRSPRRPSRRPSGSRFFGSQHRPQHFRVRTPVTTPRRRPSGCHRCRGVHGGDLRVVTSRAVLAAAAFGPAPEAPRQRTRPSGRDRRRDTAEQGPSGPRFVRRTDGVGLRTGSGTSCGTGPGPRTADLSVVRG